MPEKTELIKDTKYWEIHNQETYVDNNYTYSIKKLEAMVKLLSFSRTSKITNKQRAKKKSTLPNTSQEIFMTYMFMCMFL